VFSIKNWKFWCFLLTNHNGDHCDVVIWRFDYSINISKNFSNQSPKILLLIMQTERPHSTLFNFNIYSNIQFMSVFCNLSTHIQWLSSNQTKRKENKSKPAILFEEFWKSRLLLLLIIENRVNSCSSNWARNRNYSWASSKKLEKPGGSIRRKWANHNS
jgi:hypothetical protein